MGELPCRSQPTVPTCVVWSWHLKDSPRQERVFYIDAGKGSAVCRLLHCGTRYLIAVLARPTAQVPRWAGNVSGGPGSIPGRFWRTGVPSFRRCSTEPLHSGSVKYRDVVRPLHWPLHYRVGGWWHGFSPVTDWRLCILMSPIKGETAVHGCHCPRDMAVRMREVMARAWVGVCVLLALSLHSFQWNRIKFNLFSIYYCISWHL